MPPHRNALTEVRGSEAIARCQYAWSQNTVPKFPGHQLRCRLQCIVLRTHNVKYPEDQAAF